MEVDVYLRQLLVQLIQVQWLNVIHIQAIQKDVLKKLPVQKEIVLTKSQA